MYSVVFNRTQESGNIFWILAHAQQILRWQSRNSDLTQMVVRVKNCHSYDEALEIIAEYVDLVEVEE